MILALTLLTTGNARAADTQEEAIPWYEVEVIIFSNDEQLGLQSETWPEAVDDYPYGKVIDLRLPDDPSVLEEQAKLRPVLPSPQPLPSPAANPSNPLKPVQAATPVTPPPPPKPTEIPYLMLDPSTFQLADIDRKLRQSGKYAILLHLCWRQPTLPPDQSIPVFVYDGMTEHHAVAATDQLNGLAPAQGNPAIMSGDSGSMMPIALFAHGRRSAFACSLYGAGRGPGRQPRAGRIRRRQFQFLFRRQPAVGTENGNTGARSPHRLPATGITPPAQHGNPLLR